MESVWSKTCEIPPRERLQRDIETEIAVIGGGMAGILSAFFLQSAGYEVVVLEAERIASGQTRNTTAKITSQHGLIYDKLIRTLGEEKARGYAMANQEAIDAYRTLIQTLQIDCDLEECCACIYGEDESLLRREAEAAAHLGIPARYVREVPLPVSAAGGVEFSRQAQFHPLKFLRAVAEPLKVYEHTTVEKVEENLLRTPNGVVHAGKVIFACHYPFVNVPGLYFTRLHQERSYVLALEGAGKVEGMYLGCGAEAYSFRSWGDILLLGGESHRTGEHPGESCYRRLRQKAAEWYPECREAAAWSAQDCITPDGVPYIGRYAAGRPDWYVATGFQKWGMTYSMVAALLLRDLICGRENPYAAVFDPGRFNSETLPGIAEEGGEAIKGLAKRFFRIPKETAAELLPGQGGIVQLHGQKAGVYRGTDGQLYSVDLRCPHLGCQMEWNPDERSWDCPCHGSRFDFRGRLLSGPAQEDLSHA